MATCWTLSLLIYILSTCTLARGPMGSQWMEKAMKKHKEKLAKMPEELKKMKDHPLADMLDNDAVNTKKMPDLNPLNLINDEDYRHNPFDNALEMHDFETQHSFQHPVDMMSQNWDLLGDAVATTNFARLTPEDGGRRGVIWNKFGLHLDEWQILLEINIHTDGKLGGDGFAIWMLDEQDIDRPPSNEADRHNPEIADNPILGSFYGVRSDFNGTAIVFDTFDNNNNGDNPVVFTVTNDGTARSWDMLKDMEPDRDAMREEVEKTMIPPMRADLFPTECTLKYEQEDNVKILIRYQDGKMHVYTDVEHAAVKKRKTMHERIKTRGVPLGHPGFALGGLFQKMGILPAEGSEEVPHLCLVRTIDFGQWKNPHLAISAITGQLSDNHDILKFETKYLRKEHKIDDSMLQQTGYTKRGRGVLYVLYWATIVSLSLLMIVETIFEIIMIRNIYLSGKHIVATINAINPYLGASYCMNLLQYTMLLFGFRPICLLSNAPMLIIRIQKFMTNNVMLTPRTFERPNFLYGSTYRQFLWAQLALFCLSGFYHTWRLLHI